MINQAPALAWSAASSLGRGDMLASPATVRWLVQSSGRHPVMIMPGLTICQAGLGLLRISRGSHDRSCSSALPDIHVGLGSRWENYSFPGWPCWAFVQDQTSNPFPVTLVHPELTCQGGLPLSDKACSSCHTRPWGSLHLTASDLDGGMTVSTRSSADRGSHFSLHLLAGRICRRLRRPLGGVCHESQVRWSSLLSIGPLLRGLCQCLLGEHVPENRGHFFLPGL